MSQYMNEEISYSYESTARDYAYAPERRRRPEYEEQPVRKSARKSSFSIRGFLVVAGVFGLFIASMVNYVKLQSELTSKVKAVASKQIKLNDMVSSNDEMYARIISSVDLKEIEAIARGELGMTYATEGQVVTYSSAGNDYMRKVDNN